MTRFVHVSVVSLGLLIGLFVLGAPNWARSTFVLNMASLTLAENLVEHVLDQDLPSCSNGMRQSAVRDWLVEPGDNKSDRIWARVYWLEGRCVELTELTSTSDSIVLWLQATAFQNLGQLDQAAAVYRRAGAEDYPEKRAKWAFDAGSQAATWEWLNVALRSHPTRWVAEMLASQYIKQDEQNLAIGAWESLAHSRPETDEDYWWALGQAAELEGEIVQAAILYAKGAPFSQFPYAFWLRSGDLFLQASDWRSATQSYTQAAQTRPDQILPFLGLGHIQLRQGHYQEALIWYELADQIQPGSHWPAHFEGQVYFAMGDLTAALDRFSRAERDTPGMLWNQFYLARTLYTLDRASEAFVYVDRALNSDVPKPVMWLTIIGEWLSSVGENELASRAFRLVLEVEPATD